jgi:hypothetical protein
MMFGIQMRQFAKDFLCISDVGYFCGSGAYHNAAYYLLQSGFDPDHLVAAATLMLTTEVTNDLDIR